MNKTQKDEIIVKIPSIEQIEKSKIFTFYGRRAAITDYAIVLGVYTNNIKSSEKKAGLYWTSTKDYILCNFYSEVHFVDWLGLIDYCSTRKRNVGAARLYHTLQSLVSPRTK